MSDGPPTFTGVPLRGIWHSSGAGHLAALSVTEGEGLMAFRVPSNPHDRWAIRVADSEGIEFAWVGREFAAKIAPWMDAGWTFFTTCTATERCFVHVAHIEVKMVPIKPTGKSKTVQRETELEDA